MKYLLSYYNYIGYDVFTISLEFNKLKLKMMQISMILMVLYFRVCESLTVSINIC